MNIMVKQEKLELISYIEIINRRKWWIIISISLVLLMGIGYILITPKTYRSTTLILVESQRIPSSYVKSTITETLQNRLNTISQQVYSRTNLEAIIKEFKLDKPPQKNFFEKIREFILTSIGLEKENRDIKEMNDSNNNQFVSVVRDKIQVSLKGGRKAFEISFEWYSPQVAADVANALASQFIEENLKIREQMAMGTTNFLETEVKRLKLQLDQKEKEVERFKKEHLGMLPDELNSNITILSQLKEEYTGLVESLNIARQREVTLQEQFDTQEATQKSLMDKQSEHTMLGELKSQLRDLKSIYTPNHPDVVALQEKIHKLQTKLSNEGKSQKNKKTPLYYQLKLIKNQITNYQNRLNKVKEQITVYKNKIEVTPNVSLQLQKIQKEYGVISTRYQDLMAKKLNAEMAEELEKRQKGEQFRILDLAVPASVPSSPNIAKVGIFSLAFGLFLGGALALFRENLDPAFYTPNEIESYLGTKVVCCLPFDEQK